MTDPVEPPEVTAWKQATRLESQTGAFRMMRAGDALAAALVAAREEHEIAHRGRMHAIDALHRAEVVRLSLARRSALRRADWRIVAAEAERDRLRETLRAIDTEGVYEDDEPVAGVRAAFNAGTKGITSPPTIVNCTCGLIEHNLACPLRVQGAESIEESNS